ncbi:MAG: response regulator [Lachnospiraceae bacterium]|nr:response regulator [Lachnospiraceae bacterium]
MVTISVDDQIEVGKEIVSMMNEIDPQGEHRAFSNMREALKFLKEKHTDVVWLDVEMPGKSGLEFSLDIKKVSGNTNIVFVTGHEEFAYQSFQLHPSGFVLKPVTKEALQRELDNLRFRVEKETTGLLRVQCFGNFEVFDKTGQPVKFQRKKSKELFAYMIDRRGALCSANELCGALFEDREQDRSLKSQIRVFLLKLREDMAKVGAEEVLVKGWNANGVDCSKIDCDYFDYLNGDSYAINNFQGEYMTQYSWAEMTLGELTMKPESFYF